MSKNISIVSNIIEGCTEINAEFNTNIDDGVYNVIVYNGNIWMKNEITITSSRTHTTYNVKFKIPVIILDNKIVIEKDGMFYLLIS